MARTPMLTFSCPACLVTVTADLRKLDRHPQTPVTSPEPVAIKADCIRNDGRSWRILPG
jgi:hypothetical protein